MEGEEGSEFALRVAEPQAFGFPPEHTAGGSFKATPQVGVSAHTLNPSAGRQSRWTLQAHLSASLELKTSGRLSEKSK